MYFLKLEKNKKMYFYLIDSYLYKNDPLLKSLPKPIIFGTIHLPTEQRDIF